MWLQSQNMNILNYLTKEELSKIKTIEISKNSTLFFEEEKCDSIGIIESGKIEISTFLSNGEKVIYNTLLPGEIFGSNLIFSTDPFYKGNVVALTDSKIKIINENVLKKLLKNNEKFLINYLKFQSDFAKKLNTKIKLLSMDSAKDRMIFALENNKNNAIHFKTVNDLADYLGLSREATSRTITKLVNEGIITYKNKTISKK